MGAVIALTALLAGLGWVLGQAARRLRVEGQPLADNIDELLPQIQCAQCGYPGCRPYAEAIAAGEADINQCPPGGAETIAALAELLGREPKPLDSAFGETKPPMKAVIDEDRCIGCALCLPACPVDAILGAPRFMHTVIAAECTGCELCVPVCPVDCIDLVEAADGTGPGRSSASEVNG